MKEIFELDYSAIPHEDPPSASLVTSLGAIKCDGFGKDSCWVELSLTFVGKYVTVFGAVTVADTVSWAGEGPTLFQMTGTPIPPAVEAALKLQVLSMLPPHIDAMKTLIVQRAVQDRRLAQLRMHFRIEQLEDLLDQAKQALLDFEK